jgi:hypothetical protein
MGRELLPDGQGLTVVFLSFREVTLCPEYTAQAIPTIGDLKTLRSRFFIDAQGG